MQVIETTQGFRQQHERCVATIGKFDGVHLGHRAIVRQLREQADRHQVPAVVIVIEPHPEEFFADDLRHCPARLTEFEEKVALLSSLDVNCLLRLRFDQALASLSAERYIEQILVQGLGIRALIAGSDFRFGHRRRGDFAMLEHYGKRFDFAVLETDSHRHRGVRVSSTYVRKVLAAGDFSLCAELLGRDYTISGEVVHGRQLGRTLGFPTCNLQLRRRSLPLQGVFASEVLLRNGRCYPAVANVGYRPTVDGDPAQPLLEVHLLDFDGDLYGQRISCRFRHRLRDEQRFADLGALQRQIAEDVSAARRWFAHRQLPSAHE